MMRRKKSWQPWLWLMLAVVAGCSSISEIKRSENVQVIYDKAVELIERERYLEAGELLDEIKRRFPQSRYAVLSELRSADVQFKQDHFTEAAAAYSAFVELHPKHQDAAYALYQKALSYYNDAPENVARDQGSAKNAVEASEQLRKRYPDSPLTKDGEDLRQKALLRLAQKEAYVARFYARQGYRQASYRRWKSLDISYTKLLSTPDAKDLLAETSAKIKEYEDNPEKSEQN